jgi:hypothetical protein
VTCKFAESPPQILNYAISRSFPRTISYVGQRKGQGARARAADGASDLTCCCSYLLTTITAVAVYWCTPALFVVDFVRWQSAISIHTLCSLAAV